MLNRSTIITSFLVFTTLLFACAPVKPDIPVDEGSVSPGEQVTRGGKDSFALLGQPIHVGDPFPSISLVNTHLQSVDLSGPSGEVLVVSIVPSLDTQVCEQQTHVLGEEGAGLPPGIRKVTISRDLPFAQKRFADETGFDDILFLSDYQQANFGKSTGLLVDKIYLLARSVMVVDKDGIVRYIQVVPEISHLPDLNRAFQVAQSLLAKQ